MLLLHQDGLLEVDQQVQVLFLQDFLSGRERGADEPRYDSEKDEINSREHNSIIFSYTTKTFPNCTAVSELHMEITPHQIFTLLGPVFLLIGFHLEWMWKDHVDLHAYRCVSSHIRRDLSVRTEFAEESRNDPGSFWRLQTGRPLLGWIYACRYVQRYWTDFGTFE